MLLKVCPMGKPMGVPIGAIGAKLAINGWYGVPSEATN